MSHCKNGQNGNCGDPTCNAFTIKQFFIFTLSIICILSATINYLPYFYIYGKTILSNIAENKFKIITAAAFTAAFALSLYYYDTQDSESTENVDPVGHNNDLFDTDSEQ